MRMQNIGTNYSINGVSNFSFLEWYFVFNQKFEGGERRSRSLKPAADGGQASSRLCAIHSHGSSIKGLLGPRML
jgi:hypothetical protein